LAGGVGVRDVLQLMLDGHPRTRSELARLTGLPRTTVSNRIDALVELGLLGSVGEGVSTGGRPPTTIAFRADARKVIGIDVGASHLTVAVADLAGSILAKVRTEQPLDDQPEPALTRIRDTIDTVLDEAGIALSEVVAVSIGLPSPVTLSTGRPMNPSTMAGWVDFDVAAWFREWTEATVLVENDVNTMAVAEQHRGFPDSTDLIFVKASTGIGAGMVSSTRLHRGAHGIAGDIGHAPIARGAGVACRCGNTGCLSALAGIPAILDELARNDLVLSDGRGLVQAALSGNVQAIAAVRQAGRDIGEILVTCISFFNPDVVAVGGLLTTAGEHLIAGVRETVYQHSMPLATERLIITPSRVGPDAGVIGACLLGARYVLDPKNIGLLSR
jgi:predicted NBD/HSP70 family sugar kinase